MDVDHISDLENGLEANTFLADGVPPLLGGLADSAKRLNICPGKAQLVIIDSELSRREGKSKLRRDRGAVGAIVFILDQLM